MSHTVRCDFCGRDCTVGYLEITVTPTLPGENSTQHACDAQDGGDVGCSQRYRAGVKQIKRDAREARTAR